MEIPNYECPNCEIEMDLLLRQYTHTYDAPTGHNGNTVHTIEWCPNCGNIKQTIDLSNGHIKIQETTPLLIKDNIKKLFPKKGNHGRNK